MSIHNSCYDTAMFSEKIYVHIMKFYKAFWNMSIHLLVIIYNHIVETTSTHIMYTFIDCIR